MKIALALGVVLLIGVALVPAHALESLVLYDNFNAPVINRNKWLGNEGLGAEATRLIQGTALRMTYRAYGPTSSNSGLTGSSNRLRFINPATVTAIRATVNVKSVQLVTCPLNPEPLRVRARLQGTFFNAGTPGPPSDSTNDVVGSIRLQRRGDSADPAGILRVFGGVFRCDDAPCNASTDLFLQDLGTVALGTSATISVQWDQPNHQFIFGFGATVVTAPYTVSDTSSTANPNKRLDVQVAVPSCTALPRPTGFIDASFDDVFVNASAAIP